MTTLSPALLDCIGAIDLTLKRTEQTLDESRRDYETFKREFAAASRRLEELKRGETE